MGTEKVKEYLANFGLADRVMEFKESSATVAASPHALAKQWPLMWPGSPCWW